MEKDEETTFILNLIQNVEQNKCLYDKRNAFYFNRNVKDRAWRDVAEICGKNSADCKHKWKLLRERFCKELKRIEAPSGSGMSYLEQWRFMQPMAFLKGSLAPRRTCDNIKEEDIDSALDQSIPSDSLLDPPTSPTPAPPKKAKASLDILCQRFGKTLENIENALISLPEQDTTDEAFMKSVVCLMKGLPLAVKDDFQAKIMQELYSLRKNNRDI